MSRIYKDDLATIEKIRQALYTNNMKQLITAKPALPPRTDRAGKIALLYAFILVVMVVCQLFTFEDFTVLIEAYALPFSPRLVGVLPALIVTSEVFALPFLLRMTLSHAFRWLSLLCSWVVPLLWLFMSIWGANHLQLNGIDTVGFLGSLGNLPAGWWAVGFSLSMAVLALWASWGLWPLRRK